ncbi:MAG TPA: glycosyltransferase, partial [Planctomycetaceae bacterium]|nr:glycosyltransferase [Planctomycetaceae bacterium]
MHILYVSHGYKPAYRLGGPVWSISALAEGMVARGHNVTVFAPNGNVDQDLDVPTDREVCVDGVRVRYFRREELLQRYLPSVRYLSQSIGYMYTPDLLPVLRPMLRTIDIVHTQMPFVYPTQAAARLAIARRTPLFYSQRGVFDPSRLRFRGLKKSIYIRLIERPIMRRATGLIALTPEEVTSFQALGVSTPIHLVPNGIDVDRFRRSTAAGNLAAFGITESHNVILFMARLHELKGPDVAIEAFIRIAQRHPDAVFVLAGNDEQDLLPGLRRRIAEGDLTGRFIAPGIVTGEQKLDLLARADLFVLPSVGEGLSMAILEALASGTPAIISRQCNLPIVAEAGAGAVVERTPAAFADALSRFLGDRSMLEHASQRAYALARDH